MNTLRSLSAFGLMVFTVWAFSTTQTLGAEPVCPCSPGGNPLLTELLDLGFPIAADRTVEVCDTRPHPFLPPSPITPAPAGMEAIADSPVLPHPTTPQNPSLIAATVFEGRFGFCDFGVAAGGGPVDNLDLPTAWRCIRDLTDACRNLGY